MLKSTINWQTGEPSEFGFYVTIRKSRIDGSMKVDINQWAKDEIMKSGPLPKGLRQGWQILIPDSCEVVAWCNLKDIDVTEDEEDHGS